MSSKLLNTKSLYLPISLDNDLIYSAQAEFKFEHTQNLKSSRLLDNGTRPPKVLDYVLK
jgi:hypothetical protein